MRRLVAAFFCRDLSLHLHTSIAQVDAKKSGDKSPHSKRSSSEAYIKLNLPKLKSQALIYDLLRKVSKIIALTLLTACAQPSHWSVQHLETGSTLFDGAKLSYTPPKQSHGMTLEFQKTNETLKLFLGALEHPIRQNQKNIPVILTTRDGKKEFTAYLFEGGQRLLASLELKEALLQALDNNETITLICDTYKTIIHPEHFKQNFSKLFKAPLTIPIDFTLN